MKGFEYKILELPAGSDIEKQLNELGSYGWEVMTETQTAKSRHKTEYESGIALAVQDYYYRYFLKRER